MRKWVVSREHVLCQGDTDLKFLTMLGQVGRRLKHETGEREDATDGRGGSEH